MADAPNDDKASADMLWSEFICARIMVWNREDGAALMLLITVGEYVPADIVAVDALATL
jgi:hypothetical protein